MKKWKKCCRATETVSRVATYSLHARVEETSEARLYDPRHWLPLSTYTYIPIYLRALRREAATMVWQEDGSFY